MADYEKMEDSQGYILPKTKAVLTPTITILIGGLKIGYIQSLTESQKRPVTPQYEIGTQGIVEVIPGQTSYTATGKKLAVYGWNAIKVFVEHGLKEKKEYEAILSKLKQKVGENVFQNIVHAPIGFDIEIIYTKPDYIGEDIVSSKKWIDCYLTDYSEAIEAAGNLTVAETFSLQFKDISYI